MTRRIEEIDVVLTVKVIVDDGDDSAMNLFANLVRRPAELTVDGFGFDAEITRYALPGRV